MRTEASAEGLNLVNLLAAQWGDLFTNVGDITNEPIVSRDKENMVWVALRIASISLDILGSWVRGPPFTRCRRAGPDESYLGDPLWNSMAHWSEMHRTDFRPVESQSTNGPLLFHNGSPR